ncbi:hypothetical protein [Calderihabitans maritimus]|uniref:Uncharacterized protein n=1 Tax=Calderihabitans maritimus TaxID=1246530 RepID=A0A1Z5HUX1_9FIRM|nr:hypothetical protein [Calderihabitans maritimus]GAW93131.1 hypothetical protein KKC1_22720 [Calderihabitans maritimus]
MTGRKGLIWVALLVGMLLLLWIGTAAQADSIDTTPGSYNDPVVAQSYVEKAVEENVEQLKKEIENLQARLQALAEEVARLEALVGR